jgi:hypothetical protein
MMGTKSFKIQDYAEPAPLAQNKRNNVFKSVQRKDPGMNAEVLNKTVSQSQLEESSANSFALDESFSSPFIVSDEDKIQNSGLDNKSLLQSPFLLENKTIHSSLGIKPLIFDLEDIFMKSELNLSSEPYETGSLKETIPLPRHEYEIPNENR